MISFDFVTVGETMIRLSPPNHQTLEQAVSLDLSIGGSESNTAIALSRLGMRTAWVSKLVEDPLGRKISSSIAAHGVDTSGVVWTRKTRNPTYFIEFGKGLRPHRVTYDRKGSAINTLKASEIDWSLFKKARVVHLTGITGGLSESCRKLLKEIIVRSKKERSLISLDVNYRAKLWGRKFAGKVLAPLCSQTDILFINHEDAVHIFGISGTPEKIVDELGARFGCSTVVLTLGNKGAVCLHKGKVLRSALFPTVEVDRVGAGDAFSAGFLFGFLAKNIQYALDFAAALSSLKFTIPGDLAYVKREDVEAVLNASSLGIQR